MASRLWAWTRSAFSTAIRSLARKFNLPPLAYNAEADQKSWAEMEAFFNMLFRK